MTAPSSRFEIDVWIDAPPERVFQYFTDPKLFVEWQGSEAEFDPNPGGLYRVVYGTAAVITGKFLEIDPPNRLVYLRQLSGHDNDPSRVEINFTGERGGTRVAVIHTDFGVDEGVEWGWKHFLGRLEEQLAA